MLKRRIEKQSYYDEDQTDVTHSEKFKFNIMKIVELQNEHVFRVWTVSF